MANLNFPDPSLSPFHADNGVIYVWVDQGGGEGYWSGSSEITSNNLDKLFVEVDGDNMVGNLTLGGETNLKLDASLGKITSQSTADSDPGRTLVTKDYVDDNVLTDDFLSLKADAGIQDVLSTDSTNFASNVTVGTDKINLDPSGSGTFAGTVDAPVVKADQVRLADGTETAPSLCFDDDRNTGIYSSTDNSIETVTAGHTKLVIGGSEHIVYSGSTGDVEAVKIEASGALRINTTRTTHNANNHVIIRGNYDTANILQIFGVDDSPTAPYLGLGLMEGELYINAGSAGTDNTYLHFRVAGGGVEDTELLLAPNYANFFTADTDNRTGFLNTLAVNGGQTNPPKMSLIISDPAIVDEQFLGQYDFYGNDEGDFELLAYMKVEADESHSPTNRGSKLVWGTRANGAAGTTKDWLVLGQNGAFTAYGTIQARGRLDLSDNIKLTFGSGDDAQMYFNGAAFYWDMFANDDINIRDMSAVDVGTIRYSFDVSQGYLYVGDNIYAGRVGTTYASGVSHAVSIYTRDSANQTDTWTAYTTMNADYRGKANETTSESTHLFYSVCKNRAGNTAVLFKVDVSGSIWAAGNGYFGRSQTSTTGTAVNNYWRGAYGINCYNGAPNVSGQLYSNTYRASVKIAAVFDDADDRKSIYCVRSDTDGAIDNDQDQYFALAGTGKTWIKGAVYSGRVESDEATPNSTYAPAGWEGGSGSFTAYYTNGNCYTQIAGRATPNTDAVFRVRVNQTGDKVRIQSDGEAYSDGSWNTGSADYAEYFEWEDGNLTKEDRRGTPVVLTAGSKIRAATSDDDVENIIGVISAKPGFVGDSQELAWHGRYQKDVFGTNVLEDELWLIWNEKGSTQPVATNVKETWEGNEGIPLAEFERRMSARKPEESLPIPQFAIDANCIVNKPKQIISESFDSNQTYVPRSQRPEWDTVGLIGKLIVKKGRPVGKRWIKMSEINTDLDLYFVR